MSHLHAYFTGVQILFYARCTLHSYKFQSFQRTAKSLNLFLSQNEKGLFVSIHTVTKRSWTIVNMHFKGTQAWHFLNIFLQKPKPFGPKGLQHEIFKITIWFGRDIRLLNISAYAQPAMKSISGMLSQRWNLFRICSVCNEIRLAYAQHGFSCKNCSHFTAGWACPKICSSYAQCAMKSLKS